METPYAFPDLSTLIRPKNILVVGGSERPNSEGAYLLDNLSTHSLAQGEIVVVNPSMKSSKYRSFPSVNEVPPMPFDLVIIVVRAGFVPDILRDCAARGIPFAMVLSSGFAEADDAGKALEAQIARICAETGLRVYGPNCPGLTNARDKMGLTFSLAFPADAANTGPIGLVTQGGGAGRSVVQGLANGPGAGLWFSGGNETDLGAADFIAHLANDEHTAVISVVLEGVKHGKRLIQALALARERHKPVVILKVGRSQYGIQAAQSHTGSIAGSAQINSAMFRQFGAIEVSDLDELVAVSRLLARGKRPASDQLAVLTFSGGAAAMMADHIGLEGLRLAEFTPATRELLQKELPAFAAIHNPVDVTSEAITNTAALVTCLRAIADDPQVGAVLVPIPADYGDATDRIAGAIIDAAAATARPIIPIWMSRRLGSGFERLEREGLAPFMSLSKAVSAIHTIVPPTAPTSHADPAPAEQRGVACNEATAKAMLKEAGIPVPTGQLATDAQQAARIAAAVGFPVVMKVASAQILHKTEVEGVRLNIQSAAQAVDAFEKILEAVTRLRPDAHIDGVLVEKMFHADGRELLVGMHTDGMYGRVLTVGLGGVLVELLKDVSHRVLPIDAADAKAMLAELRFAAYLGPFRGRPAADLDGLTGLLVRFSDFLVANPGIQEAELNPVWVGAVGEGAFALDALMVMKPGAAQAAAPHPVQKGKQKP